jgi:uncharacterized protein (UPF0332 family)
MIEQLQQAKKCAISAKLALGSGDIISAINRAYYAMFYAARAALEATDPSLVHVTTHASVIGSFGTHLVLGRGIDSKHGRAINRAESLRRSLDYDGVGVSAQDAQGILDSAEAFIAAIEHFLSSQDP